MTNPKKLQRIKVGASVDIADRVEPHIIPRIDIGAEILDGAAKSTVCDDINYQQDWIWASRRCDVATFGKHLG